MPREEWEACGDSWRRWELSEMRVGPGDGVLRALSSAFALDERRVGTSAEMGEADG